jgi:hypothetical protein
MTMANMKVVALINEQARKEQAEIASVAQDLYAALAAQRGEIAEAFATVLHEALDPVLVRILTLEREVEQLKAMNGLLSHLRTDR